jgi:GLPGLI family protein
MKNKHLIVWLFLFFIIGTQAQQSGIIEYTYSYNQNLWRDPNNPIEFNAVTSAEQASKYAKEHQYFLKFTPQESIFYIEEGMNVDDVQDRFAYNLSKMIFGKGKFYQNNIERYTLNEKESMQQQFLVKDTLANNWTIVYEKKYINGYKCYKAIKRCKCGKDIVAWFTPDIPLPFGPAGYGGTPGLILELTFFNHTLTIKKFNEDASVKIVKPNKGKPISTTDLEELQWNKRMEVREKHRKKE